MMMCGNCLKLTGVLVTVAGLSFLAFGLEWLAGNTAHLLSGVLLAIAGLGLLYHGSGMCGNCNAEMKTMMKGK